MAFAGRGGYTAFGFADGSLATAVLEFATEYLEHDDVPASLQDLAVGETRVLGDAIVEKTPELQYRRQTLGLDRDERLAVGRGPILALDIVRTSDGFITVCLDSAGVFHDRRLTWKTNMLTGERRLRSRGGDFALADLGLDPAAPWARILVDEIGNLVLLVERSGRTALLRRDDDGDFALAGRAGPDAGRGRPGHGPDLHRRALVPGRGRRPRRRWPCGSRPAPTRGDTPLLEPVHVLEAGRRGGHRPGRFPALPHPGRRLRRRHGPPLPRDGERLLGSGRQDGGAVETLAIAPREDLILASRPRGRRPVAGRRPASGDQLGPRCCARSGTRATPGPPTSGSPRPPPTASSPSSASCP